MRIFNFFKSKKNGTKTNKVFVSKKHISFEKEKVLRKRILDITAHDDERNKQFNLAASMLLSNPYDYSIDSYKFLITKFSDPIAECQSQIGACFYFKGEYENAIIYYLKAKHNCANKRMIEDNIYEATEASYKSNKDIAVLLDYIENFPDGKYIRKVKKIII